MNVAEYLGTYPTGSPEWHALRANGLGGSEIAAVMGLSPWESRFSLWHRKKGAVGPIQATDEMEWGHFMEPAIAGWLVAHHPDWGIEKTGTWRNCARQWQIANPDRLTPNRIIEIKKSYLDDLWGTPGTDEVPIYYRCQVLWYMDALGLRETVIAVSIEGTAPVEYVVPYSVSDALLLRQEAEVFMHTLAVDERPDIDLHGATYQVIREMHPDIDDERIDIPADIAEGYLQANANHREAEQLKQYETSRLADHMGRARRAIYGDEQIAMRIPGRGGKPPYVRAQPIKRVEPKGLEAV